MLLTILTHLRSSPRDPGSPLTPPYTSDIIFETTTRHSQSPQRHCQRWLIRERQLTAWGRRRTGESGTVERKLGCSTVLSKAIQTKFKFHMPMLEQCDMALALVYQPRRTRTTDPWRRPSRRLLHNDARIKSARTVQDFMRRNRIARKTLFSSDSFAINLLVEQTSRYVSRLI
ncbi:uncharacterized protein M421DRAFT_424808 [Didymella exigua CBS 183.55]|uniref:Uncharacterized protein n=1 Tax=Didymella exigua CBS 183.55 TaxID=1150837 RepID=A0A6A5RA13_9PLEO|nr:uncharacterized protein M421DRAFT_424808 [Didymella exigua CBS 183.55]KAF1924363.1 hypothetical protein M421DRAFT_424808 [Didymella exigua CBS 183.55]